ncbi:hypothetical protein [Methylobacterium indicum]|uniref:Uncharacterized protein n=2 Tax=Methylobacterium indicum TaxID=1775910 RepID=A0A8H8WTJ1_9HYPH|nr:hypothetical protein [Methylobacterium indicum]BCM84131.1 hypothetical protein mvi_25920 [Methylobacterium indicum]
MSIDVFSSWAIRNIGSTISIWHKELKTGIGLAEEPSELGIVDGQTSLRFLGYVTQQHRERTEEEIDVNTEISDDQADNRRKRIVQAYEEISEKFPKQVAENLSAAFGSPAVDPFLGNVRHLGSIAPKSQSQHTPMISVRGTGRFIQSRKQAREIYRDIAVRYLQNLESFAV